MNQTKHSHYPRLDTGERPNAPLIAVVAVAFVLLVTLLPKWLATFPAYNRARVGLGVDGLLLSHPILRVLLALACVWGVRRLGAPGAPFTLGMRMHWRRAMGGVCVGLISSAPLMALGLLGGLDETDYRYLYTRTLVAALGEEFVYRAVALGLLLQLTRVWFWPAAVLTGLVFGAAHLSLAQPIAPQLSATLLVTSVGGVLFAWLYAHSYYNLWLVIALHFFMNLWWELFETGSLGGGAVVAARVLSGVIAVLIVLRLTRPASTIPHDPAPTDH